jgi:anti-anti-sigma factor
VRKSLSELGIKERRIGGVTVLESDALLRIKLRFGRSSVTLANAAASLMEAGQRHILLSLEGVISISANSLGELVSTYVVVKNGGGQLKLFNLSPTVRQLLQVTNLFALFSLYENEDDAVSSFADSGSPTAPQVMCNQVTAQTNLPKATR